MTRDSPTLVPRFLAAFIGFAIILAATFLAMHHWHAEKLEHELIMPIIERELEAILADPTQANTDHWPGDSGIYGVEFDPPPTIFSNLDPGQHEINDSGRTYQVLVHESLTGEYVLAYDQTLSETRETRLLLSSLFLALLALTVATAFGILTYRQAISPVRSLARQIRAMDDDCTGLPLEPYYRHSETRIIAAAIDEHQQRINGFISRERQFSANVSHELRTPLSVIKGAAELLRLQDFPECKKEEAVRRIEHACYQMSALIHALLIIAREKRWNSDDEKMDCCVVNRLADDLIQSRQSRANDKGLDLSITHQKMLKVRADDALVTSVIGNILDNALSYTDEGNIHVYVGADTVTVTDTGIGIENSDMPDLFHGDYPPAKVTAASGNGIGLSIVQRICEHYGWEVTATSSIGVGTTVQVRFGPSTPDDEMAEDLIAL